MEKTAIALAFTLAALLPAGALAAAPPKISGPIVVTPQPPDARAQRAPACASDGEGSFLVAWQQGAKYYERPDAKVYAARVDAGGKVLDKPIALCAAEGSQEAPRVAFAKGVYLVVWQDFRNGKDWDVYAARVSAEGKLLDREALAVAAGPEEQTLPDVAADANGFVVVWQDRRNGNGYEAWAARVSPDGRVGPAGGAPVKTGSKPARGGQVMVARAGGVFLLCWDDRYFGNTGSRFVGRLVESGGGFEAAGAAKLAPGLYGNFPTCMTGGATRGLVVSGGSQRSTKCCMGAVYDPRTVKPLPNTNESDKKVKGGSGWNTKVAVVLLEPLVPGWAPPGAAGASGDLFLVAMRRGSGGKKDPLSPMFVIRLDKDGKKLDDSAKLPVLDDGAAAPVFNPAVAGLRHGVFLVAYESNAGPGKHRLLARIVKTEMP